MSLDRLRYGDGLGPFEQAQQGLAVVPGEHLQLIEEPPLADDRQPPVAPPSRVQCRPSALAIVDGRCGWWLAPIVASKIPGHSTPALDATKLLW